MKKFFLSISVLSIATFACFAQKSELKFKPYGFIRNYVVFDTRESVDGTANLFYYSPKDKQEVNGTDLNARPSLNLVSITSRLGLDISGYQYGKMNVSAKFEADFYNMNSTAAIFRLRQAYVNLNWNKIYGVESSLNIAIGQKWHPMACDMPYGINIETGCPFTPFSRTPQITATLALNNNFSVQGALIYQMQYLSNGPTGKSLNYLKYSMVPEMYVGMAFKSGAFALKGGLDILNIKPRWKNEAKKVSDRLLTFTPFLYAEYTKKNFSINAKTTYAQAGEHLNLLSGYGVSYEHTDGHKDYTPMQISTSFISAKYNFNKNWQFLALIGYMKTLGTKDPLRPSAENKVTYYAKEKELINLNQLLRFTPTIIYNFGKLALGLEYNITSAQFGKDFDPKTYVFNKDLHWVTNNRILCMIKYSF